MENKIRIMRRVTGWVMMAALLAALYIRSGYPALAAGGVGVAIGLMFRKRRSEPDEMALQAEMFYNYAASSAVVAFLILMHAVERGRPEVADAYLRVMAAWMIAWFGGVVFKRVWK